jgi:hypothetical protein
MHSNDQNNFRFMEFNVTLIQQHFRYIVVIRFIGRGNRLDRHLHPYPLPMFDNFYFMDNILQFLIGIAVQVILVMYV